MDDSAVACSTTAKIASRGMRNVVDPILEAFFLLTRATQNLSSAVSCLLGLAQILLI